MGFGKIGVMELLIVMGIALIIFGPSKLPQLGKAMGKAISEFRSFSKDIKEEINIKDE